MTDTLLLIGTSYGIRKIWTFSIVIAILCNHDLSVWIRLFLEAIANDTKNQPCRYYGSQAKLGYIGWPLELRCGVVLEDFEDVPDLNLSVND